MYPIKFENLYYEKVWGGRDFEEFRDNVPMGLIGESWDIACHKNGMGIVKNGELKGKTFKGIIKEYGKKILGDSIREDEFPLLVKLINSKEKLSVQVHPDNEYAKKENDLGKTEAWYVVSALDNAYLIVGTKDCDREKFEKALKNNDIDKYLNKIPVKKGDAFYVQSGLVHGICEGTVIAEIQQSSDTTYRVYDYGRGRELHVKKALDVIDFNIEPKKLVGDIKVFNGYTKEVLCKEKYFSIEKYVVEKEVVEESDREKFFLFTCVDGNGEIGTEEEMVSINKGDSILIPAYLGEYKIKGQLTLLKSYV